MRVTIDLMKKSTQIIDLSNVINPRVGDDDLLLPLHIVYGDNQTDMRGKDVEFLSNDTNGNRIYVAGTCNTNTPGDNLYMGNLTFRFPAGTFKVDGTYDPDKTMFRIVDKATNKVISSVNVKITVMKNNIEFDFDPDKSSYDSRAETMLNDFKDKGQAMLDEIKDLKNQANSNVSGDTATTAKEAKKQADHNAGDISDLKEEVAGARGRFADMAGREDAQDTAINQKESIVNANANYAALKQKDTQQDVQLAQKAGKYELEYKLAKLNLQPEMYTDLDAVKAAYPNGATKLIATDDGYLALYRNNQWIKGPIFQAAGIADDSVNNAMLQAIAAKKVQVNDVLFGKQVDFGQPVKTSGDCFVISNHASEHSGVYIPISAKDKKRVYLTFDFAEVVDNGFTDGFQLYSVKGDSPATLLPDAIIKNYETKQGLGDTVMLTNPDNHDVIWVLFNINGQGELKLRAQASDYLPAENDLNGLLKKVTFADTLTASRFTYPASWKDLGQNLFSYHNGVVKFEQNGDGDNGVKFYVDAQPDEHLYLTLTYRAVGTCDVYIDGENAAMFAASLVSDGAYHTLTYELLPGVLQANNVTGLCDVLVATHAAGSKFEVSNFNLSTLNGDSSVARTIDDLVDQVGATTITRIGSLNNLSSVNSHADVQYATASQSVDGDNQVVRRVELLAKKDSKITLTVGTIDQNGLLVNSTDYDAWVHKGYNCIKPNYPINNGQKLCIKWDSEVFDIYGATEFGEKIMLQDQSHQSTTTGYEGYTFTEADGQLPMAYTYGPLSLSEKLSRSQAALAKAQSEVESLRAKQSVTTLKDTTGKAYRLTIVDGKVSAELAAPKKVAIFGNSLTSNKGGIGMAASDQYHDWYYLTSQYLKKQNPDVTINDRLNVSTWEQAEMSADRQRIFDDTIKPQLSADTDLVILQLGDNVNTAARQATIEQDAKTLIQDIKQVAPHAQIYWLASWFGNQELIAKFHDACLATGATHIDISDLNVKDNQSSIGAMRTGLDGSTWQVVIPGEAAHPGDKGMQAIADRLISYFDF